MLKGMKGYQLTQSDLEFMKKMKEEKLIKKLQGDLAETQKLLKTEMMSLELVCASREKAQAELQKFPPCEDLTEWIKVVLQMTSPLTELTDLDAKSLLAMVTRKNIQKATDEKCVELTEMENRLENKRKKEAEERGRLEKQIAHEQREIQGLMGQLSDLISQLEQQKEISKALEMQSNIKKEAPEVKAEEIRATEEVQAPKRQEKRQVKGRTKAVKPAEKLQDTRNQSKSTKREKTDDQTSVKADDANGNTSETLKTKQKSRAAAEKPERSVKEAKGPRRKGEEQKAVQVVRGRKKLPEPAQAAASQPKNPSHLKPPAAPPSSQQASRSQGRKKAARDAAEEQNTVLRRSKRIASRT
ncbi:uncharacterized protein si:dkeyp-34c12.1 isoform X2 [Centropristis striata]|nr:uncharacterized protein si:dkeyp-34c12.1 isoform X2 [Centropristis striata]